MYRLYGTKSNALRAGPAVLDDEANETQRASSSYWLRADSGKRFGGCKDENSAVGPEYAQVLVAGNDEVRASAQSAREDRVVIGIAAYRRRQPARRDNCGDLLVLSLQLLDVLARGARGWYRKKARWFRW